MTITLWTDTFATVAEADASRYLRSNKNWTAKTTPEKEGLLKDATNSLNRLRYRGTRDESDQSLSWPRSMNSDRYPAFWFETAYMYNEVSDATCAQVAYDIHRPMGEKLKGQALQMKRDCAPIAKDILRPYMYHTSPNMYEDPSDSSDPDAGND